MFEDRIYHSYSFKCPTKGYYGEINNFPYPLDKDVCPMCHQPKGTSDGECAFTIVSFVPSDIVAEKLSAAAGAIVSFLGPEACTL